MLEVELKFEISAASLPEIRRKLRAARFIRMVENSDVYYDTEELDLLQRAVFVRVRNRRHLEFKFNESMETAHVRCTERTFPLEPTEGQVHQMNALFARYLPQWRAVTRVEEAIGKKNLRELVSIETTREEYRYENLLVCIDHVKDLGDFLEVEAQAEEGADTTCMLLGLHNFAADIPLERLTVGYVELWLRKHCPSAYQLGKYQV
jgi:adenylate cyclase, class 2